MAGDIFSMVVVLVVAVVLGVLLVDVVVVGSGMCNSCSCYIIGGVVVIACVPVVVVVGSDC